MKIVDRTKQRCFSTKLNTMSENNNKIDVSGQAIGANSTKTGSHKRILGILTISKGGNNNTTGNRRTVSAKVGAAQSADNNTTMKVSGRGNGGVIGPSMVTDQVKNKSGGAGYCTRSTKEIDANITRQSSVKKTKHSKTSQFGFQTSRHSKTLNPSQLGVSTHALVSARRTLGLVRQFNVTHESNNWMIRRTNRQATVDTITGGIILNRNDSHNKNAISAVVNTTLAVPTARRRSKHDDIFPMTSNGGEEIKRRNIFSRSTATSSRSSDIAEGHPDSARQNKNMTKISTSLEDKQRPSGAIWPHAQETGGIPRQRSNVGDVLFRIERREKTILPGLAKETIQEESSEVTAVPKEVEIKIDIEDEEKMDVDVDDSDSDNSSRPESTVDKDIGILENEENVKLCEVFNKDLQDLETNEKRSPDNDRGDDLEDETQRIIAVTPRPKALKSDDFDTDFSEEDAETDRKPSPRGKNRTLLAYTTACSKCGLVPNKTFMRQCGKSAIDLRHRMLTFRDAKPIAIALVDDTRTSFLDLSDNPLGPLGTSYIAEMMHANRNIMELNLTSTDPGTEGLAALAQTLPANKQLRRLHLDSNVLQEGDGRHLAKILTNVPELRELSLNHTNLGFKDGIRLALALASDVGDLRSLNLGFNNIRTDSGVQIALSLMKNTNLQRLDLSWNGLGEDGCRALAKSLSINTTLREIDLRCNRLGIKSLEHLVEILKSNTGLTSIRLGANPLTTEGAKAVITAITNADDSSIEKIDLRGIPIDQEFVDLVDALHVTRSIEVLHDMTIQMGTTSIQKEHDGTNLDRFDPNMVLFEYIKKDNLRVIDLFQLFDQKKRDKLSRKDLRDGVNTVRLPFTEHQLDVIMKTLDKNKDGFLTLEDFVRGNKDNDRIVKQRRIKANKKGKTDRGLEDLWAIIKDIITKRKEDNEKKSQDAVGKRGSIARGSISLAPGGLLPGGLASKRGSIASPRGSISMPRGSISMPRGSISLPRGSISMARGSISMPRGSMLLPRGSIASPRGLLATKRGSLAVPRNSISLPNGTTGSPRGAIGKKRGSVAIPKN